jgi:hypothetical protein
MEKEQHHENNNENLNLNQENKNEDHSLNIIIYPYTDPVHDSPALNFPVIRRKMVDGKRLKFGRKVSKDKSTDDFFVTFQSKVVSRKHAEIWYKEGQLYFRDIGSSSGTFLNKLRLSPSGKESRPYLLRSGDVIQLGIDYHGKKEDMYKCIMMKIIIQGKEADIRRKANIERLNNAIKELISAASPNTKDTDQTSSVECCICLNTLAPYQALFLSPCTHCFHYKCVYPLLGGGIMFLCPLCRQVANLEATVSTDNLFEQEEDLKFSSKNSLYHNHKSNNSVLSPSSPTMDNNKKQTETNKSTPNLSKSHPNLLQPLKSKFTKSNESLNNSKEKQKNPSPNSNSSVAHNNEATSSSSKKNETAQPPGKKLNRRSTLKSLITTTFRRKRINSTNVADSENNVNRRLKDKNVKSTGNIINEQSKMDSNSADGLSPLNVYDTSTGKQIEKLRKEDDTGIVLPINDDPTTANVNSPVQPNKLDDLYSSNKRS